MSSQQPPQTPAAALAVAPAVAPTAVPAKATAGNAATMPVDGAHHSKDMMHSSPANREFNIPSLDSMDIEIQGAASNDDPEPRKNSVIQNNIKNLKFSIDAILRKNNNIQLTQKKLNQKKKITNQAKIHNVMQNLQSPTSKHSNVERQKSELMSNSVRSNSSQIVLHQDNENAELELQLQEVTSLPSVPPSFKAAAAAAADVAATVAAMTSVHPSVANFNRGYTQSSTTAAARESRPTATLHYMPPHQQDGQLLQSQIGFSQQQPQHGLLPRGRKNGKHAERV